MLESFFEIIEKLSAWLWGPWTMFFIAFVTGMTLGGGVMRHETALEKTR